MGEIELYRVIPVRMGHLMRIWCQAESIHC
jgi:hypothetical protein